MDSMNSGNTFPFTPLDYLKITIMGFGVSVFLGSMNSVVLPIRLLEIVPETMKNSYLGYLTFAGLVIAMVTQPVIGQISDRSRFAWGRRRPFILLGILLAIFLAPGIGLWQTYAVILLNWCLLQFATNTAQASYQSFIPDLVPENKKGTASGIKAMIEFSGSFIIIRFIAVFMDRYAPGESQFWLWVTLGILMLVLLGPMIYTLVAVREIPGPGGLETPFLSGLSRSFNIELRKNREFFWFLVSRAVMSLPGTALQTYFYYYVKDIFNPENPAGMATNVLLVVGLSLIITAAITGRLSDRFGRKPVLVSCGFIGALGILILHLSQNQLHLMISGFFIGAGNGAFWGTSWAQAADLLPKDESARFMGLTNLATVVGSGLARLIGPVIDFFNGISQNSGYSVMLLIGGLCYIGGSLIVMMKIKETRKVK
ncbi:MFS transporter [Chloroflexota bacterium]